MSKRWLKELKRLQLCKDFHPTSTTDLEGVYI